MKVNLKKMGAIVAGATILASSAAFAGLMFGSTTLVDDNGAPTAKVVLGENSQPIDSVSAALIANKIVSEAYKSVQLSAEVVGSAACTAGEGEAAGTCAISNEKARLEITVPGAQALGTWTGENLIGDYLNRELEDREGNLDATDSDQAYEIGGSDTSDNANPFTDGVGGNIGVSEEFLYRIDGSQLSTFADVTVVDDDAGNTYVEMQDLWIKGDNRFDTDPDDIVGRLDFLAYTLKFDGPGGDEVGIPECTDSEDQDYAVCKGGAGDTTIDDATETHRVKVWFLGEEWIISEMNAPTADPSTAAGDGILSENQVYAGGSVKLAKEAVSGILNQGESLPVDDLKFQLDDLEAHGDTTSAILSILDANGNILKKDKVDPGSTKEFNVAGKTYRFHVYKVAPGYTFGAKWADVAIFAKELELVDGQELDEDVGNNEGYEVALGWKNLDAQTGAEADGNPEDVDTLRTIAIFSDSIDDISSSGDEVLEEGDYVSLVQDPEIWKLSYKGLDLTSDDMASLKFELKTTDESISASKGPFVNCGDGGVTSPSFYPISCAAGTPTQGRCIIYAPYVHVTSGESGSVFEAERSDISGELSGDEFYVPMNNDLNFAAACDANDDGAIGGGAVNIRVWTSLPSVGDDLGLHAGSVFMTTSSSSNDYGFLDYADSSNGNIGTGGSAKDGTATEVRYYDIGDGDNSFAPPEGGVILIEGTSFSEGVLGGGFNGIGDDLGAIGEEDQIEDLLQSMAAGSGSAGWNLGDPEFVFAIAEKAGSGSSNEFVDYWVFGVDDSDTGTPGDATFDFDSEFNTVAPVPVTSDNEEILYGHAVSNPGESDSCAFGSVEFYCGPIASGPVSTGMEFVEEGYISERGSEFKTIDDNTVEFEMAHKLARAQWFLAPSSTAVDDASKTVILLGEGDSEIVGGVTIKVLEITEDVGACGANGGAVACTADMSGVSAVIMPDNAPSMAAQMPYTGTYGNLVILDSDAVGVNTLVSVGGDKVNSVTEELLSSSPVDWAAERKVVREVVQGSKIVVAGAEGTDTLEAAQDFVAQVQRV